MADSEVAVTEGARAERVEERGWRGAVWGLGTALCFAISPIFIRYGLEQLPSPLLGVTIGMVFSAVAYGIAMLFRKGSYVRRPVPARAMLIQIIAAVFVGLSTWARWFALDIAPVGVVLALGRLNVPVVILLSPILVGQHLERVTWKVWLGAFLIILGSTILAINS